MLLERLISNISASADVPGFDMVQQIQESDPHLRLGEGIQSYINGNDEMLTFGDRRSNL